MSVIRLAAYTVPTPAYQDERKGVDVQFDHVFIESERCSWGCFGRTRKDRTAQNAKAICGGMGNVEWVMEIAGSGCQNGECRPDKCCKTNCAGIEHNWNGVCHSCANRLLLPAGVDVADAPGNELAVPIYGKYGIGRMELAARVKGAAHRVNKRAPGSVSEVDVVDAVQRITRSRDSEYEIMMEDISEHFDLNTTQLPPGALDELKLLYHGLCERRVKTFESFAQCKNPTDEQKRSAQEELTRNVKQTFHDAMDLLGADLYQQLFRKSPEEVAVTMGGTST